MRWDLNDKGQTHWQKPRPPACVVKDDTPKYCAATQLLNLQNHQQENLHEE